MKILSIWKELCLAAVLALGAALAASLPVYADDYSCNGSLGSTTVDNLRVHNDRTCTLNGTMVKGNIFVEHNATLNAFGVNVNGNIQGDKATWVGVFSASRVGGSVQIKGSYGAKVDQAIIDGDLQAFDNRGPLTFTYNTIDGNLQCKGNQPAPTGGGNVVGGNMEDQCRNFDQPPIQPTLTVLPPTGTPVPSSTPVPPSGTPVPSRTPVPPTATTAATSTKAALAARDDQYDLNGTQISIAAPGILANDTYDKGPDRIILVTAPQHGTLTLQQNGSFYYQAGSSFSGEDFFEYRIKVSGVESNKAVVRIIRTDQQAPSITWTNPDLEPGEPLDIDKGEVVVLEVTVSDDSLLKEVTFTRWDALILEDHVLLATLTQPPFRVEVREEDLNVGWNQIFVTAVDSASKTNSSSIWLVKQGFVYLPVVGK